MKKRWMALLGAAVVTINLFAGCGSTGAEQTGNNADGTATEAVQGKDSAGDGNAAQSVAGTADTVIVAMSPSSEPAAGFNPCINWGCGEHCHEPLIQSTLIRTNVDMEFENDLATDYSVSEDGMTWTFHIRDDVKFTDGEPLTASDVAFTFNTALATPNSEADLSMLDSVEALDDTTAIFHMSKPYNAFLYTLAVFGIVPEHCYDEAAYGENPVGSGRYILTQWDKGQQVVLEANPDYYGDEVQMKKVIVLFMEEDAALAAVKAGQVDIAYTSAVYSDEQVDGYQLLVCKSVDSRGISLPVVVGVLKEDGTMNMAAMEQLMEAADGMSVTLHRAFDVCRDPKEALEQAVSLGMNTILTSGQQNSAVKGAELLAELQRQAAGRIRIQAGGGICADAIRELYPKTGVTAYHMSGKIELASPMQYRKENVNMGLPSLSEYTLYRTDVKAVRSARVVLEEL